MRLEPKVKLADDNQLHSPADAILIEVPRVGSHTELLGPSEKVSVLDGRQHLVSSVRVGQFAQVCAARGDIHHAQQLPRIDPLRSPEHAEQEDYGGPLEAVRANAPPVGHERNLSVPLKHPRAIEGAIVGQPALVNHLSMRYRGDELSRLGLGDDAILDPPRIVGCERRRCCDLRNRLATALGIDHGERQVLDR